MSFRATVLTLFPNMFPGTLGLSLAGDALARNVWSLDVKDIRDHGLGRHRAVDDTPAGGGAGMVLRADVIAAALDAVSPPNDDRPRVLLTPRGTPLTQARVRAIAAGPGVVLICGRFEGFDERVIAARNLEEMSIGDFVLSGGEPAALILLDACVRLLPGVMGAAASGDDESFSAGLLEYPHYTRPRNFEGTAIPDILLSGDHGKIAAWRRAQAEALTRARRPDLLEGESDRLPTTSPQGRSVATRPSAVSRGDRRVDTLRRPSPEGRESYARGVGNVVDADASLPSIDFWFEFASTYSYPAAMRVDAVAQAHGVAVRWRPFLLGPIFGAQGWTTSPFNLYPAKGRNMWRDLARICEEANLPLVQPNPFPQNSLLAARVCCALAEDQRPAFSRAVYVAEFGDGQSIGDPSVIAALLHACGLDAQEILAQATCDAGKAALRAQGEDAQRLGLFGAPSFVTADGELFWGNDRLEDAIAWWTSTC